MILPSSTERSPAMHFNNVVFPDPERPITVSHSPSFKEKLMFRRTFSSLPAVRYVFDKFLTSNFIVSPSYSFFVDLCKTVAKIREERIIIRLNMIKLMELIHMRDLTISPKKISYPVTLNIKPNSTDPSDQIDTSPK